MNDRIGQPPHLADFDPTAPTGGRCIPSGARVLALIPHFACEDWLAGAIESLLAQTRPVDAIVVIDDSSQVPPVDIVSAFDQVTLLRSNENVGPYRLIQQVIDATDHDAVMFQDADDWSTPDRLERLLLASEATGAELLGSDYVLFDTYRWSGRTMLFPLDANAALAAHPTGHAQQHPSGLVSRSLIERIGGYATGMRFSGDDEFLRRAMHVAKIVNVPKPLYYRRHRSDSLTTSATTGHGSAARRAVLGEMSERARANLAAAAAGTPVDLTPLRSRSPVILDHLCGPSLGELCGTTPVARVRPTLSLHATGGATRRSGRVSPPKPTGTQIVVVGAPGVGSDAVACALGQHPAIAYAGDVSWTAEFGAAVASSADVTDDAKLMVADTRPVTQIDALALGSQGVARLVGSALDAAILGARTPGPDSNGAHSEDADTLRRIARLPLTGARRWVGTIPADRTILERVIRVFPDVQVVHVLRDIDEVVGLGSVHGTVEPQQCAASWRDGVDVLLDLEADGAVDVIRVRLRDVLADPDTTLDRCLAALGEDPAAEVVRPFNPPATSAVAATRHPAVTGEARRLSTALVGSTRQPVGHDDVHAPSLPARPAASEPQAPPTTALMSPDSVPTPSEPASPMRDHPCEHPSVPFAVALVDEHVPADATVAVVSRGDEALLRFRANGRHLPSSGDGSYAGHHPADDAEAIRQLEAARAAGTRFLLVPSTAHWWFGHYTGFAEHLRRTTREVASSDGHVLYDMVERRGSASRELGGTSSVRETRPVAPNTTSAARPKVHVVSWSVSHNPYGRAHLLAEMLADTYDVELIGTTFDRFGGDIWRPLADQKLPLRTICGGTMAELLPRMEEMAATLNGDAIVVSKPRFPSFGLAMLAKSLENRPIILDVDDRELAFVNANQSMTLTDLEKLSGNDALLNPFGGPWTRYCDHLIEQADAVTVSNVALQDRYGGDVIGHARDEKVFDPARFDRAAVRATLGFDTDDRVVLFGGTPRRHKGIGDIAAALRRIGDPRLKFCLIDTVELAEMAADLAEYSDLIHTVPYQRMGDLPALVLAADLVCVLQDPTSPVAHYQIPAKITDALAMQTPCLTTYVPPLADLAATGALALVNGPLHEAIEAIFDDRAATLERAELGRAVFLEQLSYAAVRPRLAAIIDGQIASPRPVPHEYGRAIAFARSVASGNPPLSAPQEPATPPITEVAVGSKDGVGSAADVPAMYDVVVFWKQNDTGIYARRHDMLLEQFARSPRIGRIIQFDHSIGISTLEKSRAEPATSHGRLVYDQTLRRMSGFADDADGGVLRRTFVYENRPVGDPDRRASSFPPKATYLDVVARTLADANVGTGARPMVLWGYPKNFDLGQLIDRLEPDLVVMDVVDDHRTWHTGATQRDEIDAHYTDLLTRADLTLTNCAPMMADMQRLSTNVHLVANGCQWPPRPTAGRPPTELTELDGPIIGYVGNLSDRIDVELLDAVAVRHPDWNLVFVGSTHAGRDVLKLNEHDNVHFFGPRRASEADEFVDGFDVAIIPHLDDAMTRKMNPLKAFVYCNAGVPVVSTAISGLDEVADLITVAETTDDFIAAIETALATGRPPMSDEARNVLARHAWSARMADVERLVDNAWRRR